MSRMLDKQEILLRSGAHQVLPIVLRSTMAVLVPDLPHINEQACQRSMHLPQLRFFQSWHQRATLANYGRQVSWQKPTGITLPANHRRNAGSGLCRRATARTCLGINVSPAMRCMSPIRTRGCR